MKKHIFTAYMAVVSLGLLLSGNAMAIEEAKYSVLEKHGSIELRLYAPHIVAETAVDGDFEDAGNQAFGRLFNYISGSNRSKESIAMTAPVGQQKTSEKIAMTAPVGQQKSDGKYLISFMMPSKYTMDTLPEPTDGRVVLRQIPQRTVAAIRYSGTWSQKRYAAHEQKLRDFIAQRGYAIKGEPNWARYNPPFTPWFLRRNEILMEIEPMQKTQAQSSQGIYAFTLNAIDGKPIALADYKGKVVLVVNVASHCGFTKQYAGLQELYTRYKDRGFVILGFPANNFGGQEPGSDADIQSFCATKYNVTFPMFSKISVGGEDIAPLYAYLTDTVANAPHGGAIKWNFTKFLIGKDGRTIARFGSSTEPLDGKITEQIDNAL